MVSDYVAQDVDATRREQAVELVEEYWRCQLELGDVLVVWCGHHLDLSSLGVADIIGAQELVLVATV